MDAHDRFSCISMSVDDRVGIVTLNRPEVLNACNTTMHRELQEGIELLEAMSEVGAITIRGAGRAFCAGSDLRETGELRGEGARRYIQLDFATKNRLAGCTKPTIAAIHGHCVGEGVELALACDVRIATEDACFSLREIELGAIPGSGGLQRLPSVVGLGVAKDWALTGRVVEAQEALERGLVSQIIPTQDLDAATRRRGAALAARNPVAVHLAKVAMEPAPPSDYGLAATYHMIASEVLHSGRDFTENTRSYL